MIIWSHMLPSLSLPARSSLFAELAFDSQLAPSSPGFTAYLITIGFQVEHRFRGLSLFPRERILDFLHQAISCPHLPVGRSLRAGDQQPARPHQLPLQQQQLQRARLRPEQRREVLPREIRLQGGVPERVIHLQKVPLTLGNVRPLKRVRAFHGEKERLRAVDATRFEHVPQLGLHVRAQDVESFHERVVALSGGGLGLEQRDVGVRERVGGGDGDDAALHVVDAHAAADVLVVDGDLRVNR